MSTDSTHKMPLYLGQQALEQLASLNQTLTHVNPSVEATVKGMINAIQTEGDAAVHQYINELHDAPLKVLHQTDYEWNELANVSDETVNVLKRATDNIRQFAEATMDSFQPVQVDHDEWSVGLDWRPIKSVACYVPAGRYPLPSTALMTAITAKVAGVNNIVMLSPKWEPATLVAAKLAGVDTLYQLGGAHGVAALALGTPSIPKVDMIVGPGNAYVTEAKRQLQGVIGIDMLAGPSEVGIIADDSANPEWVALDLLAQAEHDPDARAYLLTTSETLAHQVQTAIIKKANELKLPEFVTTALNASGIFVLDNRDACCDAMNQLAPEHLELLVDQPEALKPKLNQYGALFMGHHTPVPFGDYMMGPNHTLPTNRSARFTGALSPMTFLRPQTWSQAKAHCPQLATDAHHFATLEGLAAHGASSIIRCPS